MFNREHVRAVVQGLEAVAELRRQQGPERRPPGLNRPDSYPLRLDLRFARLPGANLSGMDLSGSYLDGTELVGARLVGTKLRGAKLIGTNLAYSVIEDADFQEAELLWTNLAGTNFARTTFERSRMISTFFSGTVLKDCDFSYATLTESVFVGCDLSSVSGLNRVNHFTSSRVDVETLLLTRRGEGGELSARLRGFFLAAGVPTSLVQSLTELRTNDDLLQQIWEGEGQRTEYKTSFREEDEAIRSLGAFANAQGGTVYFGIKPDGTPAGVQLGANTLENFANKARKHNIPLPTILTLQTMDGKRLVAALVESVGKGRLASAFGESRIRVGRTNQLMSPEEKRTKLLEGIEGVRQPSFECVTDGGNHSIERFQPDWHIKQVGGDYVPNLQWRFIGPRFQMDWRSTTGDSLPRMVITQIFDILGSALVSHELVGVDELGLEIKFFWLEHWWHELHRWPLEFRKTPGADLVEWGPEITPAVQFID